MKKLNLHEQFRLYFEQLRSMCNDSPQTLINFFRERPDIEASANRVKLLAEKIEHANSSRKIHPQVSPEFIRSWKHYISNWKAQVEYVEWWPILSINLLDEADFELPNFEDFEAEEYKFTVHEPPDPSADERFNPNCHDGGSAIMSMVAFVRGQAGDLRHNAIDDETYECANIMGLGVEAIEHLQNVIGIDLARAYDRWNRMPAVFVPKHVSDNYGLTEDRSLFGLFNQAVRAYVAGAPAAATAMCRSLLETVLRNHYLRPQSRNERDKIERANLGKVIELAVARYDFLDKEELDRHKENANKILHNYTNGNILAQDEANLLQFFRDLKNYIEQAPSE